jgi:membrane-associated phospholipid phosphatase
MLKVFNRNRLFYYFSSLYIVTSGILWLAYPKGHLIIWFNERYTPFSNLLFKTVTDFGDGLFSIVICILLLFVRYYWAWLVFLSYGISSILAQLLKRTVFSDSPRPKSYFGTDHPLQFVEGIEIFNYNSFPSGHTTSAFAVACILSLIFPSRWLTIGFSILAIFAGISRIYLAQHFVEDTCAGAIIGTLTASLVYYWQDEKSKWKNSEKSLLK